MKLSILDYGLLDEGATPAQAFQEIVALAQKAEALGFHRFWVAEHHNVHALTISHPELMMMHLLNQTTRIRIGSGGIMALHYSSLKLAETIKTLEALFPNRVDIGLGNSLGTPLVNTAMNSIHHSEDYEKVLSEVATYLNNSTVEPVANPNVTDSPPMWLLSMGIKTATLAGKMGLGYTYGVFPYIVQEPTVLGKSVADAYRQSYKPSGALTPPHMMLAVFVAIADTSEEAEYLAKSLDVWMLGNQAFNEFKAFPSLETAMSYKFTDEERERVRHNRQRLLVGTKEDIMYQLQPWINACQPDELLLIPLVAGFDNRMKSLELLSQLPLDI
ncbi:LLM class flavin-dependent oxidoreductase [Streptococcus fryi]